MQTQRWCLRAGSETGYLSSPLSTGPCEVEDFSPLSQNISVENKINLLGIQLVQDGEWVSFHVSIDRWCLPEASCKGF